MGKIRIAMPQEKVTPDHARMRDAARLVLDGERVADYEVTLAFVDDETIQRRNKQFLGHDEPTDVLTFPMSAPRAKKLEADVMIGVEVASREAQERGHDVQVELTLYVIHGVLHLCGYDDLDEKSAAAMRERERHYLKALGLPDIAPRAD
jgi:probable rRNA maturation factor